MVDKIGGPKKTGDVGAVDEGAAGLAPAGGEDEAQAAVAKREKAIGGSTAFRGGFAAADLEAKLAEKEVKAARKVAASKEDAGEPDLPTKLKDIGRAQREIFTDPALAKKAVAVLGEAAASKDPAVRAEYEKLMPKLRSFLNATPAAKKNFDAAVASSGTPELKADVKAAEETEKKVSELASLSGPQIDKRLASDPAGLAKDLKSLAQLAASDNPEAQGAYERIIARAKQKYHLNPGANDTGLVAQAEEAKKFFDAIGDLRGPGADKVRADVAPIVADALDAIQTQTDEFTKAGNHGVYDGVGRDLARAAEKFIGTGAASSGVVASLAAGILRYDQANGTTAIADAVSKTAVAAAKSGDPDARAKVEALVKGIQEGARRELERNKALTEEGKKIVKTSIDLVKKVARVKGNPVVDAAIKKAEEKLLGWEEKRENAKFEAATEAFNEALEAAVDRAFEEHGRTR